MPTEPRTVRLKVGVVNGTGTPFSAQIQVAADGTITGAPYIATDPGVYGFTVFWNDPVNNPGQLQGQATPITAPRPA